MVVLLPLLFRVPEVPGSSILPEGYARDPTRRNLSWLSESPAGKSTSESRLLPL